MPLTERIEDKGTERIEDKDLNFQKCSICGQDMLNDTCHYCLSIEEFKKITIESTRRFFDKVLKENNNKLIKRCPKCGIDMLGDECTFCSKC